MPPGRGRFLLADQKRSPPPVRTSLAARSKVRRFGAAGLGRRCDTRAAVGLAVAGDASTAWPPARALPAAGVVRPHRLRARTVRSCPPSDDQHARLHRPCAPRRGPWPPPHRTGAPPTPSRHMIAAARPSGTVTFLFTDIEGSTALWDRSGSAMSTALETHDDVVRGAIERYQGVVFAGGGDGFAAASRRRPRRCGRRLMCSVTLARRSRYAMFPFGCASGFIQGRQTSATATTSGRR